MDGIFNFKFFYLTSIWNLDVKNLTNLFWTVHKINVNIIFRIPDNSSTRENCKCGHKKFKSFVDLLKNLRLFFNNMDHPSNYGQITSISRNIFLPVFKRNVSLIQRILFICGNKLLESVRVEQHVGNVILSNDWYMLHYLLSKPLLKTQRKDADPDKHLWIYEWCGNRAGLFCCCLRIRKHYNFGQHTRTIHVIEVWVSLLSSKS